MNLSNFPFVKISCRTVVCCGKANLSATRLSISISGLAKAVKTNFVGVSKSAKYLLPFERRVSYGIATRQKLFSTIKKHHIVDYVEIQFDEGLATTRGCIQEL